MHKFGNFLVIILAGFALSGCAQCVDCGRMVMDHRVTSVFTSATINPDYRYYYSGNEAEPDAIMGLRKEYTLTGGYWYEKELTQEHLAWWVDNIETSRVLFADGPNGFEIVRPDGGIAGLYYSRLEWVVIKFPEPGVIYVSTPDSLPWKQEEKDDVRGMGNHLRL